MRAARIIILWLVGGLIIGFLIWYLPPKLRPQYTAQTFIRVLPGYEKGSVVALIKHQSTLESLVDKDAVQKTGWFQHFGKTRDDRMAGAVADLKKRFRANTVPDSDFVVVRLTCRDAKDAATVLNEMVDLFLKLQQTAKKKQIAADLGFLEVRHTSIQRDLDLSEQECDNVRRRYGYADLEQHSYPDPAISRLIDLRKRADSCALEIGEVQFFLEDINAQPSSADKTEVKPNAEVKELQAKLRMLQSRLAELQAMREEAKKEHNELNLAKAQYAARQKIRDERRQALDSIKSRVEETKTLYDDPDASGLQFVDDAIAPRQADTRQWQAVIPSAVLAAVIAGIGYILLTKRASKVSS
jgi:uncharacterized protein involved in exopolysaccharide biosynthesis